MSKIVFFGSGSKKWESICTSHNAFFADVICNAGHLGILAEKKFNLHQFTDISHSEPAYLKEFYTHAKK
jgi:tRNA threonylcarbamoyladenosine biosynthesis protein TsaB